MSGWTEEQKNKLIEKYKAANPTPENSMEIVKEIAEGLEDKTANGVRMILMQADVYIKKAAASATGSGAAAGDSSDKPKRVSKADAIAELESAITDAGQEISDEITSKLTGKAAQYFAGIIRSTAVKED